MEALTGWWQTMTAADIDNDGDIDLVLGNFGENFYLKATAEGPVKLWIKDFDQNDIVDKMLTRTYNGKDVPVFMKREVTDQVPSLNKLNLKHQDFASKTIQELFGNELNDAVVKQVKYTASCIAYNDGKGNFTLKALPYEVQLSSVNAIHLMDINKDGFVDIVAAGNFFDMLPQFCRLDASGGQVLINDKKGGFVYAPVTKSGLNLYGQIRDIVSFKFKNEMHVLFLWNNDFPVLYKLNENQYRLSTSTNE